MNSLKKFRLKINRRFEDYSKLDSPLRVFLEWEATDQSAPGLRWQSFLLLDGECLELFRGEKTEFRDIVHNLHVFDESWTFYDLPCPSAARGEMSVPYNRIQVPHRVRHMIASDVSEAIARYDQRIAAESERDRHRVESEILDYTEKLGEWSAEYGRGKGSVKLIAECSVRDRLGALKKCGGESFERSWASIEAIARNTTLQRSDVAEIHVNKDWDGFFWRAGGTVGGLINHGTEEEPSWSVHT
jgi:hypothetical protein